jgi:hypothetical protein
MQAERPLRRMKRGPTVKGSVAALALDLGHEDFIDKIDILIVGAMSMSTRADLLTQTTAHSAAYRWCVYETLGTVPQSSSNEMSPRLLDSFLPVCSGLARTPTQVSTLDTWCLAHITT